MRAIRLVPGALAAGVLLAVAGCEGPSSSEVTGAAASESGTPGASASEPAIRTVAEGWLTVCSDVPYAPFEMEAEDGDGYTGFDIELVEAIAERLGVDLRVVVTGFDAIRSGSALREGRCDLAASAIPITEEREEDLDLSEPYYDADLSLLVRAHSGIAAIGDLSGRDVGVVSATVGEAYAVEHAEGAVIVPFEDPELLLAALGSGEVDAVLQDRAANVAHVRSGDGFAVVETYPTGRAYGLAVAEEGSEDLLAAIDAALAGLRQDGTYDALHERYFGVG